MLFEVGLCHVASALVAVLAPALWESSVLPSEPLRTLVFLLVLKCANVPEVCRVVPRMPVFGAGWGDGISFLSGNCGYPRPPCLSAGLPGSSASTSDQEVLTNASPSPGFAGRLSKVYLDGCHG